MKTSKITLLAIILSLVLPAFAKAPPALVPKKRPVPKVESAPAEVPYALTEEQYNEMLKEVRKEPKRSIASDGDQFSPEFVAFRENLLATKTAEEIDPKIDALFANGKYEKYPSDLKFAAAWLKMLPVYRSFLYRIKPLVENPKILHSTLLTLAQGNVYGAKVFLPNQHTQSTVAYITQPMNGMKPRIATVGDFQNFLSREVIPQAQELVTRLSQLAEATDKPFSFDNQLIYGPAAFVDGADRYRLVGKPEIYALISMIEMGIAQNCVAVAYDLTGTLQIAEELGKLYGVDGFSSAFWGSDVQGAQNRDRVYVIKREANFGKLVRPADMKTALAHVRTSVFYGVLAWDFLKDQRASDVSAIDPAIVNAMSRQMSTGRMNLIAMLKGPTAIRSQVTGEVMTVDIPKFFTDPPADLKDFLPNDWNPTTNPTKTVGGKSVSYRDFNAGSAKAWPVERYQKYFPDVKTNEDVPKLTRVLAQSYGASGVSFAIGAFVF